MVDEGLSVGVAIFVYQLDSSLSAGPYSSTYNLGFPFNTACPCAITQELCARIICANDSVLAHRMTLSLPSSAHSVPSNGISDRLGTCSNAVTRPSSERPSASALNSQPRYGHTGCSRH